MKNLAKTSLEIVLQYFLVEEMREFGRDKFWNCEKFGKDKF